MPSDSSRLIVRSYDVISQLTGSGADAGWNENWNVTGTDLGFSFMMDGRTYLVFGDTWGRTGVQGPDWRSNIMAIAEGGHGPDFAIADMITDGGEAKELLSSQKRPGSEYTVIPTSGIAVNGRMFLHYMSIRDWVDSGWGYKHPAVNGAGIAYSDDRGQTWIKDETAAWEGEQGFSQVAMVEHGDHVYVFGTPSGRFGDAKLMRAPMSGLLKPSSYEYWDGDEWSGSPADASVVVPSPVGELSVRWSERHQRWLMMYLNDQTHNIVLRTAKSLTGEWSDEQVVVSARDYPTLYGPFMLPEIDGPDVYFTMSLFNAYNVFLVKMRVEVE